MRLEKLLSKVDAELLSDLSELIEVLGVLLLVLDLDLETCITRRVSTNEISRNTHTKRKHYLPSKTRTAVG